MSLELAPVLKIQTLTIEGLLCVDLSHDTIKSYADKDGKQWHVGAWVGGGGFFSAAADPDGKFRLAISLRPRDVDVLKLQIYVRFADPETGITKPFPVLGGLASLRDLGSTKTVRVEFKDQFGTCPAAHLDLRGDAPIGVPLVPSILWRVREHNAALQAMCGDLNKEVASLKLRVPGPVGPFMEGLTFLPNGGSEALGIPPVQTSFTALSKHVYGLDRPLPHAFIAYLLQLSLTHSGRTMDEVNALPAREFAKEAGNALWGLTCDADGCPYEPDRTVSMGLTFSREGALTLGLVPTTSENIGLPFGADTFIGDPRAPAKNPCPSPAAPAKTPCPSPAAPAETPCNRLAALQKQILDGDWAEFMRDALKDDCETSAIAGLIATSTVHRGDMSERAFTAGTRACAAFQRWTPQCIENCSKFFTRVQSMLRTGELQVALGVGLAGGASATDSTETHGQTQSVDDMENLGGHCFAILRHVQGDTHVRILEGTTCCRTHPLEGEEYTAKVASKPCKFRLDKFLTLLCQSVARELQVINKEVGGAPPSGNGWRGKREVRGFVRETIVMPCLHSLPPNADIPFYKWCFSTGLTCSPHDVGCIPLEEKKPMTVGCPPVSLCAPTLRALAATLPPKVCELGTAVLDEIWPPLASQETFTKLLNTWGELVPLSRVNQPLQLARNKGVTYISVACMETPCAPALVPLIFEANTIVIKEANRINFAKKGGDGVFVTLHAIGTGVSKVIHVPKKSLTLTYLDSLREAKLKLKAPGVAVGHVI